jgi:hypothetical protein
MIPEKHKLSFLLFLLYGTGPVMLLIAVIWFTRTQIFLYHSVTSPAKIVYTVDPSSEDFGKTSLEFTTSHDGLHKLSFHTSDKYEKGEHVEVVYPEEQPKLARINTINELYSENFYFALLSLFFCMPWYLPYVVRAIPALNHSTHVGYSHHSEATHFQKTSKGDESSIYTETSLVVEKHERTDPKRRKE